MLMLRSREKLGDNLTDLLDKWHTTLVLILIGGKFTGLHLDWTRAKNIALWLGTMQADVFELSICTDGHGGAGGVGLLGGSDSTIRRDRRKYKVPLALSQGPDCLKGCDCLSEVMSACLSQHRLSRRPPSCVPASCLRPRGAWHGRV
jgi:hypothetical protein